MFNQSPGKLFLIIFLSTLISCPSCKQRGNQGSKSAPKWTASRDLGSQKVSNSYDEESEELKEVTDMIEPQVTSQVFQLTNEIRGLCNTHQNKPDPKNPTDGFCMALSQKQNDEVLHFFMSSVFELMFEEMKKQIELPADKGESSGDGTKEGSNAPDQESQTDPDPEEPSKPGDGDISLFWPVMAGSLAVGLGAYEIKASLDLAKGARTEALSVKKLDKMGKRARVVKTLSVLYAAWALYLAYDLVNHLIHLIEHPSDKDTYIGLGVTFFIAAAVSVGVAAVSHPDKEYLKNYLSKLAPDEKFGIAKHLKDLDIEDFKENLKSALVKAQEDAKNKISRDGKLLSSVEETPGSGYFSRELDNPETRIKNLANLDVENTVNALMDKHHGIYGELKVASGQALFAVSLLSVGYLIASPSGLELTESNSWHQELYEKVNQILALVKTSQHYPHRPLPGATTP